MKSYFGCVCLRTANLKYPNLHTYLPNLAIKVRVFFYHIFFSIIILNIFPVLLHFFPNPILHNLINYSTSLIAYLVILLTANVKTWIFIHRGPIVVPLFLVWPCRPCFFKIAFVLIKMEYDNYPVQFIIES